MTDVLTAAARVKLARDLARPHGRDYIDFLLDDFFELAGDRLAGEDRSIVGGIGLFHEIPVTVIAQQKGHNLKENLACNFGMPSPDGYRKAQRLARQAEKFGRPVITIIDTPGAYPGIEAEQRGQGEAIARCLMLFSGLEVPVVSVIVGEGCSGGALALAVADEVIMLENAVYSILSPEGFASILWKDAKRSDEAAELMRITAAELQACGVVDHVIAEGEGGIQKHVLEVMERLDSILLDSLVRLSTLDVRERVKRRDARFASFGDTTSVQLATSTAED